MTTNYYSTRQLAYLSPWFEDVSDAKMESLGVSGGLSGAVIWRVTVGKKQLCLRRWPQAHPSLTGLLAIHGLLAHLDANGCDFVPVPLTTRFGKTFFDHEEHFWELTPWLAGEATLSSEPTAAKLTAAVQALAKFHRTSQSYKFQEKVASTAPSPGLRQRLTILRSLQKGELQQLWLATRSAQPSDLREQAFELLEGLGHSLDSVVSDLEQLVEVPLPLQWCLQDVRHDHFLFTGERVSGLIDFGAASVDSVGTDLSRLLGSLVNDHPSSWQTGVDAYMQVNPLSTDERRAIAGFDEGGLLCSAANWVRWLFVENRSFPQIHALHAQLLWLRDRLQALALRSRASTAVQLSGPAWGKPKASSSAGGVPQQADTSPWMHT